jgi:hypothetical protein
MIASEMKASHGICHDRNAGRIEMKAIEMPASASSIAARGVYLRKVGPMKVALHIDDHQRAPFRRQVECVRLGLYMRHSRPTLLRAASASGCQSGRANDAPVRGRMTDAGS